jgi:protein-tyrosine phosphatase
VDEAAATVGDVNARWVDLHGAVNVRDLGGLPLRDGGTTAAGVLLRADNLQDLTACDVTHLVDDLGVRVVVDLRTEVEVGLEGPGRLVAEKRVEIRERSLLPQTHATTDVAAEAVLPWQGRRIEHHHDETPAVRAYLGYLRDRPDSIVGALRDIAIAPGAVLVHCAAGKDRTGMVCALALDAAGARRDAIVADYVATGERLREIVARLRASPTYAADLDGRSDDSHLPRPQTMERVLAILDERAGGPTGWLAEHGFGREDLASLRRRLAGAAR